MARNQAKPLVSRIWGTDFVASLPLKWKSAVKYKRINIPGVDNGTPPDEIGVDGVITSEVIAKRINELDKTTNILESEAINQHVYHEQDYDEQFDVGTPTDNYLTVAGAELGQPRRRITGLIPGVDEVTTISPNTAVLDNYLLSFPGTSNVDAPDFLESIKVFAQADVGDGSSSDDVIFESVTGNYSYTLPIRTTAQGSVNQTVELVPILKPIAGTKRNTVHHMFFLPAPVTAAQVTAKLATLTGLSVVSWPNFKPKPVTIVTITKRVSLQVSATYTTHKSNSDDGSATIETGGTGYSREIGTTVKTIRVPSTVHESIFLDDPVGGPFGGADSVDVTIESPPTTVDATAWTQTKSLTETATCRVIAEGLSATGGAFALPTTGLLIIDVNARPYKYGYVMVQTESLNASTL